jgi:hypothetical protein
MLVLILVVSLLGYNAVQSAESLRLTFNGLRGVISQKTVLVIIAAVRTSNPTFNVVTFYL